MLVQAARRWLREQSSTRLGDFLLWLLTADKQYVTVAGPMACDPTTAAVVTGREA